MLATINFRVHRNYYMLETFSVNIQCGTIHSNLGVLHTPSLVQAM